MIVREARADDAPAVAALVRALGYTADDGEVAERLSWFAASVDDVVQVSAVDGELVGFVTVSCTRSLVDPQWFGRITALSVAADHRRGGVGRRLVAAAEAWAAAHGSTLVQVNSGRRPERAAAHEFYPALGYRDQHDHHVLYEKHLNA